MAELFSNTHSNDARFKLLERRMTGDLDQPHQFSLSGEQQQQPDVKRQRGLSTGNDGGGTAAALQPGSYAPRVPLGKEASQHLLQYQEYINKAASVEPAAGPSEAGLKRKRNSSPVEQRPLAFASPQGAVAAETHAHQLQPSGLPRGATPPARSLFNGGLQQQPDHGTSTAAQPQAAAPPPSQPPSKPTPRSAAKTGGGRSSAAAAAAARGQTKLNAYYPVIDGNSRESDMSGNAAAGSTGAGPGPMSAATAAAGAGGTATSQHHASHQAHAAVSRAPHNGLSNGGLAGHQGQMGGRGSAANLAAQPQQQQQQLGAAGGGGSGRLEVIPEEAGAGAWHHPQHQDAQVTRKQRASTLPASNHRSAAQGLQGQAGAGAGGNGRLEQQGHGNAYGQQQHEQQQQQPVAVVLLPYSQRPVSSEVAEVVEDELRLAIAHLQGLIQSKDDQLAAAAHAARQSQASHSQQVDALSSDVSRLSEKCEALAADLARSHKQAQEKEARFRIELTRVMQAGARGDRELLRLQLAANSTRLGTIGVHRVGIVLQEVWEDGPAIQAVNARAAALTSQREEVDAARKALRKKLPPPPIARQAQNGTTVWAANQEPGAEGALQEFIAQDEIYKMRLAALKREEELVREEAERLALEKQRHVRALKRLRDEEGSRFGGSHSVLGNRFVLLSLLGKGGFSEVFKAYDLSTTRVVAAKVHQLNPGWSEGRKASYVKHAIREVDIQKALKHPCIVSLVDILEIDAHSFATVLEYCDGGDLDTMLREHTNLPEKEARAILAQIMSGLVYLNQPGRRIIHYDLKPANILFDTLGGAKITDFGLSKVVEEGATQGMELTSQGAGTYWYLPPECFEVGGAQAPRISNKVDVWSVGVILYQMLFGKRPFGEGLSQEAIMREGVMRNVREVEFPSKPAVSAEAKEFMRRCLAPRQADRWDVLTAAQDPYVTSRK